MVEDHLPKRSFWALGLPIREALGLHLYGGDLLLAKFLSAPLALPQFLSSYLRLSPSLRMSLGVDVPTSFLLLLPQLCTPVRCTRPFRQDLATRASSVPTTLGFYIFLFTHES